MQVNETDLGAVDFGLRYELDRLINWVIDVSISWCWATDTEARELLGDIRLGRGRISKGDFSIGFLVPRMAFALVNSICWRVALSALDGSKTIGTDSNQ